jgi:hypothetical protein
MTREKAPGKGRFNNIFSGIDQFTGVAVDRKRSALIPVATRNFSPPYRDPID